MKKRTPRAVLTPGQVIKELRAKKGWTQAVLAEITGMAVSNISNLESGVSDRPRQVDYAGSSAS